MTIGQKIREARLMKGATQQELGDMVGVQKSAIAKYESGRVVNIKMSTLKKIASVLNINPSELFIDEQCCSSNTTCDSDEAEELLREYCKLDKATQQMVRDLICKLAKD